MKALALPPRWKAAAHRLPPAWRWCLPAWLLARALLWLWAAAFWLVGLRPLPIDSSYYFGVQPLDGSLLGFWQRWDAINYQRIASMGYSQDDLSAFFPLYPLLGGLLHRLAGGEVLLALILVSNLVFLVTLVLLYLVVEEQFSTSMARGAVITCLLFPTAFYFFAPYPQSLALLLTLLAYFCARRNHWGAAMLAGTGAGLAHSTVIPLAIMLAVEVVRQWRERKGFWRITLFLIPLAPLMGISLFLAWRSAQGFAPLPVVIAILWNRVTQWPWQTLLSLPQVFTYGWIKTSGWVDLLLLGLSVWAVIAGWKKLPRALWLYQVSLLLFILSNPVKTGPLVSFGRYLLMMFPLYLLLADWCSTRWRRLAAVAAGITLQLYLSGMFFLWMWVE